MQENLKKSVTELAEFLEVKISDEKLQQLCDFVHIDKMKTNPAYSGRFDGTNLGILRQGKTGGWKDVLTENQSEYIDEVYGAKIKELGLPVKYW